MGDHWPKKKVVHNAGSAFRSSREGLVWDKGNVIGLKHRHSFKMSFFEISFGKLEYVSQLFWSSHEMHRAGRDMVWLWQGNSIITRRHGRPNSLLSFAQQCCIVKCLIDHTHFIAKSREGLEWVQLALALLFLNFYLEVMLNPFQFKAGTSSNC